MQQATGIEQDLQAELLQQGFENAAARRQQDLANQISISQFTKRSRCSSTRL